jgi:hypothetical protein
MRHVSGLLANLLLSLMLAPNLFAGEAAQADWSSGGGIPGPVAGWQNRFASSQAIDWANQTGPLTLAAALPTKHIVTNTFGEPAGVAAGDLDGDGDLDIASVAYQGNSVSWMENDGSGGGWTEHTIATSFGGACSLHLCDLDRDGDTDVAATAENGHSVIWWANDGAGGGWAAHVVDSTINGPYSVCDADFDGDGDPDLCSAAYNSNLIVWYENRDGAGALWLRHPVDTTFSGAWWADAEDIDRDGDMDIAGVAFVLNDVCWWENTGAGSTWVKHFVDPSFSRPVIVRVADMDGDTRRDILAASYTGQVAWWSPDLVGGTWTKHLVASGLATPFSVRAADLDGDGDQDVITNARDGDNVMWFENVNAQGLLWYQHMVDDTSDGPNDVLAADMDGDTAPDIIATFSWDNSILWYKEAGGHVAGGSLESSILDLGGPVNDWGSITWTGDTPPGTSMRVEVHASGNPADLGSWTEIPSSGTDLSAYIANFTRYFQYRVSLASTDVTATPRLDEIRIEWDYLTDVGEGGPNEDALHSCGAMENPSSSGTATISFVLPRSCAVELSLFDLAGRRLRSHSEACCEMGRHSATFKDLPSGIYLYRLRADRFCEKGKVVVR